MPPKLYTAADFLAPLPGIQWQLDRILPVASVGVIFGAPGSKKTWSCLDLAVCTALGKDWLGTFPVQKGAALLIDEESGPRRLADRLGKAIRGHLADASLPIFATSLHGFNLWSPPHAGTAIQELRDLILQTGARLVVLDTLADLMLGGDENAVRDTQPVFYRLRQIAEATGAAMLVIHHAAKNGGYRGSSAIHGAVDVLIETESQNGSIAVKFETTKCRDGEPLKFMADCHFQPAEFWLTGGLVSAQSQRIKTAGEEYVLRYLNSQPGFRATKKAIEDHADSCSVSSAQKAIYRLTALGVLRKVGGGQGAAAVYELDPAGLAANP